jgi:hypothetical protein
MQAALSFTCGWSGSSNASRPIFHLRVEREQQCKPPCLSLAGQGARGGEGLRDFSPQAKSHQ